MDWRALRDRRERGVHQRRRARRHQEEPVLHAVHRVAEAQPCFGVRETERAAGARVPEGASGTNRLVGGPELEAKAKARRER